MAKDELWHGIPRKDIPWFPTVDPEACIGCTLCFLTCGRGVYDMEGNKSVVVNPYNCMVGCSTCATVCPTQAIAFPDRELIWKLEREHKIFGIVRKESAEKKAKLDALKARAAAEDAIAKLVTRVKFEVAGEFDDKNLLGQMQELVENRPYDFVNVDLKTPTVKGTMEKTPSFMSFEVTSTEQADIQEFLPEVRDLVRRNGLVLVSESKL
ncbi:ferredoxin family protein [uncultured Thermanaerothrix sp.]|uniref:4Fe-4S dicluster domain-containing protein n=1 Tax=uncultured Thermanaerothrix sp. TaxID=1195149 RepID=UPI00260A7EB8|nr:ferredoxin family protein [uncultured Thermanaerothrix sp.]